jgi:hypothetical protein
MRDAGIEACLYTSARAKARGTNVALFVPAFRRKQPYRDFQTWRCATTREAVELKRKNVVSASQSFRFARTEFLVDGVLPRPAL